MAISNPVMSLCLNLGLTIVVLTGAYRVNMGYTMPGTIIAFMSYFTIILNAMLSITKMFTIVSKGIASANRIDEILHLEPDIKIYSKEDYPDRESDYYIEFDNVSFSYLGKKDNISNLSFGIKYNETLGIIGNTGAGKSTILLLLLRFYDADSGNIYINGEHIKTIPFDRLHNMFGIVFQNDFLEAGNIRDNIDFGRDISDSDIIDGIKYAQAYEFVDRLADGLMHNLVSHGSNLSGGQKQRVLLSRALCNNHDILILDDSSSALDYKTDALLRQAINEHLTPHAALIVAQRVSSIMYSDRILVIENGKAIGYGTHDELMKQCDIYRDISTSQMGGLYNAQ